MLFGRVPNGRVLKEALFRRSFNSCFERVPNRYPAKFRQTIQKHLKTEPKDKHAKRAHHRHARIKKYQIRELAAIFRKEIQWRFRGPIQSRQRDCQRVR
jgi:hypothetical protein